MPGRRAARSLGGRDVRASRGHGAGRVRPRRLRRRASSTADAAAPRGGRAGRPRPRVSPAPGCAATGTRSPARPSTGRDLAWTSGPGGARSHTLGAELLRPSVLYAPAVLELRRRVDVHALAHVTGGGHRRQPGPGPAGALRRGAAPGPHGRSRGSSRSIQAAGDIADEEMEAVFNLGLGMLAVVAPEDGYRALDA